MKCSQSFDWEHFFCKIIEALQGLLIPAGLLLWFYVFPEPGGMMGHIFFSLSPIASAMRVRILRVPDLGTSVLNFLLTQTGAQEEFSLVV